MVGFLLWCSTEYLITTSNKQQVDHCFQPPCTNRGHESQQSATRDVRHAQDISDLKAKDERKLALAYSPVL